MVGVIVVTHGNLASGLVDAARMIVGETDQLETIGLMETEDIDGLMARIQEAISKVDSGEGTLILVDLPGASPFNASARIAMQAETVRVVTGVNLPMLAELLVMREGSSLDELVAKALEAGKAGVMTLSAILNRN